MVPIIFFFSFFFLIIYSGKVTIFKWCFFFCCFSGEQ
jgi:hypothetical protein